MILGRTGAGKTTLSNVLFGIIDNEDRIGPPSETEIIPRTKPGFPYTIYDTPGFELENTKREKLLKNIRQIIEKGNQSKNINERIHCILYCINSGSNRLHEDEDILIRELTSITSSMQVPVIIVITQPINDDEVEEQKNFLQSQNYNIVDIIPVLVRKMEIDGYIMEPYGIDELLTCISKNLPDHLQLTLQNLQEVDLKSKIEKAKSTVDKVAVTNFGVSAVLPPSIDFIALMSTEIMMLTRITYIFGFNLPRNSISFIVSSIIGPITASFLGRSIFFSLLKLVPGAGQIASICIGGSTAATITIALGNAYILLMEKLYKGEISFDEFKTTEGRQKIQNILKQMFDEILDKEKTKSESKELNSI
jgi:uncharacterized protein (DUF697 family)